MSRVRNLMAKIDSKKDSGNSNKHNPPPPTIIHA